MAHVKFYNIPEHLELYPHELSFDGDKSDKKLFLDPHISWHEPNEEIYNEIEQEINEHSIKGNGWEVYTWCDISGYDYWKEGTNYIQITIAFDSENVNVSQLDKIKEALAKTQYKFEDYESYKIPDQ